MRFNLIATAALWAAAASFAADLPKAEALLDRYVEATGGRATYEKRTSEYLSGTVEIPAAGVRGKVEMWAEAPNSRVEVIDIEGVGRIETGTDGTIAWENSAIMGPRLRSGEELRYHLREAMFNAPIYWQKLYKKAETTGVETAEGIECYKVTMTPIEGKPEVWFFDQKTSLVIKMIRSSVTSLGEVTGEFVAKDYKDSGGILLPSTLIQRASGQEIRVKFDQMVPNAKMPKDRFQPPAEVKQVMNKKAA